MWAGGVQAIQMRQYTGVRQSVHVTMLCAHKVVHLQHSGGVVAQEDGW